MKRIIIDIDEKNIKPASEINNLNTFIKGWFIKENLCDDLISFFENLPEEKKHSGKVGNFVTDTNIKKSLDYSFFAKESLENEIIKNYLQALEDCCFDYIKMFPWASHEQDGWSINEQMNIQKYKPSEGFYSWHSERMALTVASRHLVFMTYLNDVTDSGETDFFHQKIKVVPKKGLTIIWPADWTYTHRGIPSPTQVKYIITGWYSYNDYPKEEEK
jgi:hypothetical protein